VSKNLKNIGIVSFLTVISRFLGVFRDSLGVALFGASGLYSAFLTAWSLPNLFRRLLAEGSLTAAFIPTLQEELHHQKKAGAFRLLSQVTSWLLAITGVMVAVAMVVFRYSRLLPGHPQRWYQAADLAALLFPYLIFIAVTAACNATLNVLQRFTEPTLSPIWLNLAMIASLGGAGLKFAHSPMGEMYWLVAGVLVGGFLQMTISALVLMREGWRPRFDLKLSPRVQEIAWLMVPGLFGTAIYQINILVSRLLAFSIDDASATLLFNGNRLMEFPIGVFAIAVSTVVYPLIARHAVEGNRQGMAEDYRKGLRLILIINVPAAAGLALLARPIVDLIYRHGHFGSHDAVALARLVALFAIGLPFFSVVNLTVRAFYAVKDTATPVKVGVIDFMLNVILSVVLMRRLGTAGLVIASTSAIVVQTLLLQRALVRRLPELTFRPLWRSVGKVALATLAMSAILWPSWHFLQTIGLRARLADLAAVLILIPAGIAVYALVLWLLRIEGREDLAILLRRLRPGSRVQVSAVNRPTG
jgi:putative peptidoglycan lipid II flippase